MIGKEVLIKIFIVAMAVQLIGCADKNRGLDKNSTKYIVESMANGDIESSSNSVSDSAKGSSLKNPYEHVDIDMTSMSTSMSYATASRMNMVSEEYIGKIVQMSGKCSIFHDEKRDIYFFTCEINDETACCIQGIEFELMDGYKFPDEYPKENDEVTVIGVFDTYKEGAKTFKTLRKAFLL